MLPAYILLSWIDLFDFSNWLVTSFILGGMYLSTTLHTTEVGHRGAWLLLGKRRRFGPHGHGVSEGLNSSLFPPPLARFEDVDCRKKDLRFDDMKDVYSKDNVLMEMNGVKQYSIEDPYEFLDAEDPVPTLLEVGKRAIRTVTRRYEALNLPDLDRSQLSQEIERELERDLKSDSDTLNRWGIKVDIIRINTIRMDGELEKALRQRVQEGVESDLEAIQTKARVAQVAAHIASGVAPNVAAAMALIDAGKPANLTVFSGLEGSQSMIDPTTGKLVGAFPGAGSKNKPRK
jgi:regulator of protease activity HflC (stomatin/prohibitin superfamily)